VGHAVFGVAEACIPDPDSMLYDLLVWAIADCSVRARREPEQIPVAQLQATPAPPRKASWSTPTTKTP
jgi:hypothetical protein